MKKFSVFYLFAFFVCSANSMYVPGHELALFDPDKPLDISYLDTHEGAEHLRNINATLKKNGLYIHIEKESDLATISINLCAPSEDRNGITLLPLFTFSRPLATHNEPREKLLPEHLNKMVHAARLIGAEPEITNPIKEEYLKRIAAIKVPFRTKIIHAWHDEIRPTITTQLAQHIGKELAKACLIGFGAAEASPPIQKDWEKQLSDRVESLSSQELEAQRLIFLKKYSELKSTSSKQDELFNTTYEHLIDSTQGVTR
jgi:hypothetical protein